MQYSFKAFAHGPGNENSQQTAHNDIAGEVHAEVNARIASHYGKEQEYQAHDAMAEKPKQPRHKPRDVGCMT